jgi:hypothetical protein
MMGPVGVAESSASALKGWCGVEPTDEAVL